MEFLVFKAAVAKNFDQMSKGAMFRVNSQNLWETYLDSFPAGSDPIYKERTEHNCNCCKQFITAVGNVVSIENGQLKSIWDISIPNEPEYQIVADALSASVKSSKIMSQFFHFEKTAGTRNNFQQLLNGEVKGWEHFFVNIPDKFVKSNASIPSIIGSFNSQVSVFTRALEEITIDSVNLVLDLISQNSLYRGEEQKFVLGEFLNIKTKYDEMSVAQKNMYVWQNAVNMQGSILGIRNSVIGTLLTDLSDDVDLEKAVKSYEAKVAPQNYKRPTALVTKGMIDKAKKEIESLGFTSALERRYAVLSDITVNNILYANRDVKKKITDDIFDELSSSVGEKINPKTFSKVEEVGIEKFISDILPRAESIEVMFENSHMNNLVSLIAPKDPTSNNMFTWDNKFSWSYKGEVTDSIKEKVKSAGGNITGDVCCRLAWYNYDDLDLYMVEPNGYKIYFGNRRIKSSNGGMLDVDMNAGSGTTRTPVENIFYRSKQEMQSGKYELYVHNFSKRENIDLGFDIEIDICGEIFNLSHPNAVQNGDRIKVATIEYNGEKFTVIGNLKTSQKNMTGWGITTNSFHKVNVMMMSPNYWDEMKVGNKHYFFMIDGCANEEVTRGFYNEFLNENLNKHRKVLEMVGSKLPVANASEQLSGLGFSSTQKQSIMCRVKGSSNRVVKIVF